MRFARFATPDGPHVALVDGDTLVDLTAVDPAFGDDPVPILAAGPAGMDAAAATASAAPLHDRTPLDSVRLLPPVPRPPRFVGIGFNFRGHDADPGSAPPGFPLFFNKQTTCAIGPNDPILAPPASDQLDYEGELVLVIGRRCRNVPAERASEVVAGCMVGNDVSARDWQRRSPTVTLGKSFDGTAPVGPWVTTLDEVGDVADMHIRTWVNDELVQDGHTADMITDCWEQIALLSSVFTLLPGDLISTGTPPGAAQQQPDPRWLRIGDRVRVAIDGLGELDNAVAEGSTATEIEPPAPWPAAPWPVAPWPVEPTGRTRP